MRTLSPTFQRALYVFPALLRAGPRDPCRDVRTLFTAVVLRNTHTLMIRWGEQSGPQRYSPHWARLFRSSKKPPDARKEQAPSPPENSPTPDDPDDE